MWNGAWVLAGGGAVDSWRLRLLVAGLYVAGALVVLAFVLAPKAEAVVLAAAHAAVHGGQPPERRTTAVNDTRYYGLYFDIPGLCYGPKGEGAHAFDERTSIEDLRKCTRTIATFIADWCGIRAVSAHLRSP